jgi:hypothetical protein
VFGAPLVAMVVGGHGLSVTYAILAAVMALLLLPLLFVVDYPPNTRDASGEPSVSGAVD